MSKETVLFEGKECRLVRRDGLVYYVNKITGKEILAGGWWNK